MALAAEQTSATTRFTSIPAKLPVYWHLLSLDAPTVAALWCWSFSRVAHIDLPVLAPALLAVGTWLIYVADRILDGLDRTNWQRLRERHFFYSQHRSTFLIAGAIVSPAFAWIIFTRMSPAARLGDAAVFAFAAFYFLIVHTHGRQAERWLPKELAVGVLFAVATAVPTWARDTNGKSALVPPVAIFAVLCWLNCVAIESWEGSATDSSHSTTSWAARHLRGLASTTLALSLAMALLCLHDGASVSLFLASAMSAFLLVWLASRKQRFGPLQLRVAVDAALLTPLLFVAWLG
ncbi:hypothetical protein H7849_25120 [Alloacidobacterium dinghuense]|uniref:UbiA prenyltransferase family protein n=1 Tax=Alloacidobacterium dinghuense TaxID=2763107 RepID=A0A7G8BI58_9BACT|nr:hypothetical protein [Alloacidobacterium dinghuense]QNI32228.1 hypothetical protein H7849_25120 [Alloacidobacterium dinghuense]